MLREIVVIAPVVEPVRVVLGIEGIVQIKTCIDLVHGLVHPHAARAQPVAANDVHIGITAHMAGVEATDRVDVEGPPPCCPAETRDGRYRTGSPTSPSPPRSRA